MTDFALHVWGDFACFSRPELKVERFSYPLIAPSAARGIYDAIYCKPNRDPTQAQFRWQITRIEVLRPPKFIALRRNEVKEKVSVRNVTDWMEGKADPEPILADADKAITGADTKGRTQRQTMALKDVDYRLHARLVPWPGHESKQASLEAQFLRRAEGGKCVWQPYFGCREFPAFFEPADPEGEPPCDWSADLGFMLYDVFDLSRPGDAFAPPVISVFHARVNRGVLDVPAFDDPAVLRAEGGAA